MLRSFKSKGLALHSVRTRRIVRAAVEMVEPRRLFADFTVTTVADSGAGSLREAITLANTTTDPDTIVFNIPGTGVHRIQPASPLPSITEALIIDGYTQPGSKPNTLAVGSDALPLIELNGDLTPAMTVGLAFGPTSGADLSGSAVRGLIINGNFFYGVQVRGGAYAVEDVTIAGNWIGLTADGQAGDGISSTGVQLEGASRNNRIGGTSPADRNVFADSSLQIGIRDGGGNVIENNYLGLNAAGTTAIGSFDDGISIGSSDDNRIGGITPASRNVIAVEGAGVQSTDDGERNRILGNYIGTAADGVSRPAPDYLGREGVTLYNDAKNNFIGGDSPAEGNVIAYVETGVEIEGSNLRVIGNSVRHNSIFNTGKAIDLYSGLIGSSGNADINDYGDNDEGANRRQNFAAITSATVDGTKTTVGGYLNSQFARGYLIDFYASPADGTPYTGEAKTYLGTVQVVTDAYGNATFSADLPAVPAGTYITNIVTSLATYPYGDSSQVSPSIIPTSAPVAPPVPPSLSVGNVSTTEGNSGTKTLTFTVKLSSAAAGPVTVNYKTTDGTAKTSDNDYVAKSGTLSFAAGQTSKTVSITIKGDTKVEGSESFNLLLSSAVGATISDGAAVGSIINDDAAPALPKLSVGGYTATEGHTGTKAFTFKVTLDKSSTSAITVKYATSDDTAKAGTDYTAASGTLTFAAGQTSKTVTIYVKGDKVKEAEEKFFLLLSNPTNATIAVGTGTGRIQNDD